MNSRLHRFAPAPAFCFAVCFGACLGAAVLPATGAPADKLVYSFTGTPSASQPEFGLTLRGDGNYYGVSASGGANSKGTIYRIKPKPGNQPAVLQLLYSFKGGMNGERPNGAMIADGDGNLYGVAIAGGAMGDCGGLGCGVVYQLSPPLPGHLAWVYTVIYRFHHIKGSSPVGSLAIDAAGNLYGATRYGGSDNYCTGDLGGCGVIFKLKRPAMVGDPWTFSVLHDFQHATGAVPTGGLTFNSLQTALYGSASGGGTSVLDGMIFRLLAPAPGKIGWAYRVVYNFLGLGSNDGSLPNGNLFVDDDDIVYGTTQFGGTTNFGVCNSGCGTVFSIKLQGNHWVKTDIHKFTGGSDGRAPLSGLTFNGSAHYVGTTQFGGSGSCGIGCGTVFSITGGGSYLKWLSFPNIGMANDGLEPTFGPLLRDASNFYAVMPGGGANSQGAVVSFSVNPPGP